MFKTNIAISVFALLLLVQLPVYSQNLFNLKLSDNKLKGPESILQKPTKKVYFTPGGKIGMFFLQGDYSGNQMIALVERVYKTDPLRYCYRLR